MALGKFAQALGKPLRILLWLIPCWLLGIGIILVIAPDSDFAEMCIASLLFWAPIEWFLVTREETKKSKKEDKQ